MWTYLTTPFLLAMDGVRIEETGPWQEGAETWHVLRAYFPGFDCDAQRHSGFFFGKDLLLRRQNNARPRRFATNQALRSAPSTATIALAAGVSPKVVSEQLRNASTAFTLDTYTHVLPHMQDEAVARVEECSLERRRDH
jgi:hypothetical protein